MSDLQNAEMRLIELNSEQRMLAARFEQAVVAGADSEAVRLHGRQRDLPGEIVNATFAVQKARIAELEQLNVEDATELGELKRGEKNRDDEGGARITVLRGEIMRINNELLAALGRRKELEQRITERNQTISRLRGELEKAVRAAISG